MDANRPTPTPRPVARVYGVATILAPLLLLASTVAFVTDGQGLNVGVLGGVIGVWAALALVIAFVGIIRLLEPAAPRGAAALTVLALSGFAAGVGFDVGAIVDGVFGADEVNAAFDAAIASGGGDALLPLAFLPWGLFGPAAMIVAGILLWRTRVTARWSGALLALGGVLFVIARPERLAIPALVADTVLVAALVPIGWRILREQNLAGDSVPAATARPVTPS